MIQTYEFEEVGRLPLPGDNVAIATCRLERGATVRYRGKLLRLDCTVMEGHRFAVRPIAAGEFLLSWELPFGRAVCDIEPGTYVRNREILDALSLRRLDFELPEQHNFEDWVEPYHLDQKHFFPGRQVDRCEETRTFLGYGRDGGRGVGTRNYIVVLGTSSRTSGYARALVERLHGVADDRPGIDGVVAVAHTEGGENSEPNNKELLLRTLAGFVVHPNVAAVLAVDYGVEAITNQVLRGYMEKHGYPLNHVLNHFMTLSGGIQAHLEEGERRLRDWLDPVGRMERGEHSLTYLKIALQCGGSDAFSGISGNPLVARLARELIRHGGAANLAETDELIGAESYVLQNVRNLETARKFLKLVEHFKDWSAWHGNSADANPSGGNKLRGIYNIVLKSIGAARKRDPDVCLDYAIDYGETMREPGYYFMNSPGNDLESIAGQVASGSNLIFFVTGNGSITNFPFVPTIKIITTTSRYELLSKEMDLNAGKFLDGNHMDELGRSAFEHMVEVASGARSLGELAGHSQVQIWRDWRQQDGSNLDSLLEAEPPRNEPLDIQMEDAALTWTMKAVRNGRGRSGDQLGLVVPTSLCSGQIARICADRLNAKRLGRRQGISRFAALVHTEGCGASAGINEQLYIRTLLGYLTHPLVKCAVLLEHGCEKTHNDFIWNKLEEEGIDPRSFGWASVQLNGGLKKVLDKVEEWFAQALSTVGPPKYLEVGLEDLHLGLLNSGPISAAAAQSMARLTRQVVGAGGRVVVPENAGLLKAPAYVKAVFKDSAVGASLAYGHRVATSGFYIMEAPTGHWVETLTGLGATGVEIILAHIGEHPVQGHPMVPVVQVASERGIRALYGEDVDLELEGPVDQWADQILELLAAVGSRRYVAKVVRQRNTDFQLTRGLLGTSA